MLCIFTFSFDHFPLTNPDPPKRDTAITAAIITENAGYACQGVVCGVPMHVMAPLDFRSLQDAKVCALKLATRGGRSALG